MGRGWFAQRGWELDLPLPNAVAQRPPPLLSRAVRTLQLPVRSGVERTGGLKDVRSHVVDVQTKRTWDTIPIAANVTHYDP